MAKENILARPGMFLKSCIIRTGWLWAPWPNQSNLTISILIGAWYTCIFCGALLGGIILWIKLKDRLFYFACAMPNHEPDYGSCHLLEQPEDEIRCDAGIYVLAIIPSVKHFE